MRHALSLFALIVLAPVAAAQHPEPTLVFYGDPGRPGLGWVLGDDPGDCNGGLFLDPVICVPKLGDDGTFPFVIIEVPGGDPILVPLSKFNVFTPPDPGQSTAGQVFEGDGSDDFMTVTAHSNLSSGGTLVLTQGAGSNEGPVLDPEGPPVAPIELTGTVAPFLVDPIHLLTQTEGDMHGVAVGDSAGVHIWVNAGGGGFVPWPSPQPTLPLPGLQDIAVGDIDGNGLRDIVMCSSGGTIEIRCFQVTVPEGLPYGPAQVLTPIAGAAVASVELADFNADEAPDLLVALHLPGAPLYSGRIRVYRNDLEGPDYFNAGDYWQSPVRTTTHGFVPTLGAVGDAEGDGDLDAVFTEAPNLTFPPSNFAQSNPPICVIRLTNVTPIGESPLPAFNYAVRFTPYSGRASAPILADFRQRLVEASASLIPVTEQITGVAFAHGSPQIAGSLEADEELPVTFISGLSNPWLPPPAPTPTRFPTGARPGDGDVGQLSTDDDALDVVIPNRDSNSLTVWLNEGFGIFPVQSTVPDVATLTPPDYAGGPRDVRLAEFLEDGALDAVVYSEFEFHSDWSAELTVFVGDGHGQLATKREELVLPHAGEMIAGDVDGDGHVDVLVTRRRGTGAPQDLEVHFGVGDGTLDAVAPLAIASNKTLTGGLALRDVDNDGDLDAATTYASFIGDQFVEAGVLVYRNKFSAGSTMSPLASAWPLPAAVPDVESLVLGQLVGSSAPDVAIGHRDGTLWLGSGFGDGRFASHVIDFESRDTGGGSLALADMDGNQLLDIVSCKGEESGQAVVQVHLNLGTSDFDVTEVAGWCPQDLDGGTRPLLGNFDLSGAVDLIVVHPSDAATVLLDEP